jgi:RHS repeat-associated protein
VELLIKGGGIKEIHYSLVDASGSTHELQLEKGTGNRNVYHSVDGAGYTFLAAGNGDAFNYYEPDNNGVGAGTAGSETLVPITGCTAAYWLFNTPFEALIATGNTTPFGGVRSGTVYDPSGLMYTTQFSQVPSLPPFLSANFRTPGSAHAYSPSQINSTVTDTNGNAITRGPWYWSDYPVAGPVDVQALSDFQNRTALACTLPSSTPPNSTFPHYYDSVGRTIPDILSLQSALASDSITWTVPGPGTAGCVSYFVHYIYLIDDQDWTQSGDNETDVPATHSYGFAIDSITLPNGSKWQFAYSRLDLLQVTLPTGGSIAYEYANQGWGPGQTVACGTECHAVTKRTVTDPQGATYVTKYTYHVIPPTSSPCLGLPFTPEVYTVETDPELNDTVHVFSGVVCSPSTAIYESYTDRYQGTSTGDYSAGVPTTFASNQLSRVTKGYAAQYGPLSNLVDVLPSYTTTSTPNSSATVTNGYAAPLYALLRQSCTSPVSPAIATAANCNVVSTTANQPAIQFNLPDTSTETFNSSPFRTTSNPFAFESDKSPFKTITANQPVVTGNYLTLPGSMSVTDDTGTTPTEIQSTTYSYDDNDGFSPTGSPYGNLTSIVRSIDQATSVTTKTNYLPNGMPHSTMDGNLNSTTITYDTSSLLTGLLPGTIVRPATGSASHQESFTYYPATSLVKTHTDENNRITQYVYDNMGRLTSVANPDGGSSQYCYTDVGDAGVTCSKSSAPPYSLFATVSSASNTGVQSRYDFDGFGRVTRSALLSDPEGAVLTDTAYDGLGRVQSVSNPYRTGTPNTTTFAYDALGRKTIQQAPDWSMQYWCYDGYQSSTEHGCALLNQTSFTGVDWTNVTDEAGNVRQMISDAAGRMVAVVENPGTTSAIETDYTYNPRNDLIGVVQDKNNTVAPKSRSFTYDWLSRLVTSSNPETGIICYGVWSMTKCTSGYDGNGNLLHKTDARNISVNYFYDSLNRLTTKTYSDGVTPSAQLNYDEQSWTSNTPSGASWLTAGNRAGRLSSMSTSDGRTAAYFNYDSMGRMVEKATCIGSRCGSTAFDQSFSYDLAGNLTSYDHGTDLSSGSFFGSHVLSYDTAGRLQALNASQSAAVTPPILFQATSYGPTGLLTSTLAGGALTEGRSYDTRARQTAYNVYQPTAAATAAGASNSIGYVNAAWNADLPAGPQPVGIPQNGILDVSGWAATGVGCPVAAIEVDLDQTFIGRAQTVNNSTPNVSDAYGHDPNYLNCGFSFGGSVGSISPGTYPLHLWVLDENGKRTSQVLSGVQPIVISNNPAPTGYLDPGSLYNTFDNSQILRSGSSIAVGGWAVDSQLLAPVGAVKLLVDGNPIGYATLGGLRPDLVAYYNGDQRYLPSGWTFTGSIGDLTPGSHTLTAMIYDSGGQSAPTPLGFTFTVPSGSSPATGVVDNTAVSATRFLSGYGWAAEPATPSCSDVSHVDILVDGIKVMTANATEIYRGDVDTNFATQGCGNAGYTFGGTLPSSVLPGEHTITARAYDHLGGSAVLSESQYFANQVIVPGNVSPVAPAATAIPTQYAWALGYEPNGNIGNAYDSVNGNWAYLYDGLNRLVASGSYNGAGLQWQYDNFGNMLSQTVTGGYGTTKQFNFTLAGAARNQPDGTCFDAAGNQLDDYGCGQEGTHEYVYDGEGRVASANWATYVYDAMGQRTAKYSGASLTSAYLYDLGGHVITELNGSFAPVRREVYAGGRHLGTYDDSGGYQQDLSKLTYALTDWLGTERARATSAGALCQTSTSQPFGDAVQTMGSCSPSPAFFTGKERDVESGNDYFGARYYNSVTGRWLSPDWSANRDPVPYAKLGNPQSLNLYAYMFNSPLAGVDPDGHLSCAGYDGNTAACVNDAANTGNGASDGSWEVAEGKEGEQTGPPKRGDRVKPRPAGQPPIPLPPGQKGEVNEWEKVPGSQEGPYGPRFQPKYPVSGPQPSAWWDSPDGQWTGEKGDGSPRDHYDRWGNKINKSVTLTLPTVDPAVVTKTAEGLTLAGIIAIIVVTVARAVTGQ